jgi:hypothetical protein
MIVSSADEGKIEVRDGTGAVLLNVVSFNTISKVAELYMEIKCNHPVHGPGTAMHNVVTVLQNFDAYDIETGKKVGDEAGSKG